jgi:hypothetical protein
MLLPAVPTTIPGITMLIWHYLYITQTTGSSIFKQSNEISLLTPPLMAILAAGQQMAE